MHEKILFVDDEPNVLASYRRMFHDDYVSVTSANPDEALHLIEGSGPFALILSDYNMPQMDGIRFLSAVRTLAPQATRVMLTGRADMTVAINAINEGSIFRFLTKPCPPEHMFSAISAGVQQYRLVTAEQELLEKTLSGSIQVLTDILSIVNPTAFSRAARLRGLAQQIAAHLHSDKHWEIEMSAMLSPIGLVTIPPETIDRLYRGIDLTETEKKMLRRHPAEGRRILEKIPRLETIAEAVGYQAKAFDGTGLPEDGRKALALPLAARILKVAIDFDALTTTGLNAPRAIETLLSRASQYDPQVLTALRDIYYSGQGGQEKIIGVNDMKPGMILCEDLHTQSGTLLVIKGTTLTDMIIRRLNNFVAGGNVLRAVRTFVPDTKR